MNSRKKRSLEVKIHPWQGLCINNFVMLLERKKVRVRKKAIVIVRLSNRHGPMIFSALYCLSCYFC